MFDHRIVWRCLLGISLISVAWGQRTTRTSPVKPSSPVIQPAKLAPFHNGDTLVLSLSTHDANRFRVMGDTIAGVVCPPTSCRATVSPNDPSKSAYLTIAPSVMKPFTVHVSTLDKRYFSLVVTPADQSGSTVLFEPQSPGKAHPSQQKSESWVAKSTQLIRSIVQHQPLDGYAVVVSKKSKKRTLANGVNVKKLMSYRGESFTVSQYQLTNATPHWIRLSDPQFYQVGVVAVALSSDTLSPHSQAMLYQVTTTGGKL